MKGKKKLALLGGDLRQYTAAVILSRGAWDIKMWGLDKSGRGEDSVGFCRSWEEAIDGVAGVVLPLPASTDGVLLNCPFDSSASPPRLSELLSKMKSGDVIVGGKIPATFSASAGAQGIRVFDYFESEEFQIHNAYTTAEAAISIAMNSLDKNVSGAKIAITGYGRIAKHLVRLLKSMDVDVTVAARKDSDLAWAYSNGCSVLKIGSGDKGQSLSSLSRGYDVIYNTVPHWLFDREFLESMDPSTFIIDLASVPGGVDICAAKELGSNVLWATSLPGKYAPRSAGELIASCVDRILTEEVGRE